MIISVTERGTFRRCREMWALSSRSQRNLTPIRPSAALSFGSLVHKVHENWLLDPAAEPAMLVAMAGQDVLDNLTAAYKYASGGAEPDESELDGIYEQISLAQEVFKNYKEKWGSSLPVGFTLVQPEQTIIVKIPGSEHPCEKCFGPGTYLQVTDEGQKEMADWGPDHLVEPGWMLANSTRVYCTTCEGSGVTYHYLEATLDALIKDDAGNLWVLERKTYGQRPRLETLEENDQFLAYNWVLTQLELGPVGGILYDGMWKHELTPRYKLDDLFIRTKLTRGLTELQNFEKQLLAEVFDMASCAEDPGRVYRNFRWEGCYDCGVRPICLAEFRGEDSESIIEGRFMRRDQAPWLTPGEEVAAVD